MSPAVPLSPATFARLQKHAVPLIDNPETVINRVLDFYENGQGNNPPSGAVKDYSGRSAPNLSYAKLLSAELEGKNLVNANWNRLLIETILIAANKLNNDLEALKQLLVIRYTTGQKDDHGFRYIPQAGVSVQGQDANAAWKGVAHIAKALGLKVKVLFVWYDNEKALHPGETGKLSINTD